MTTLLVVLGLLVVAAVCVMAYEMGRRRRW